MTAFESNLHLEQAWSNTIAQWSEPSAHDELFRLVHAHGAWVWAARRYRDQAKLNPSDAIAARHLRRLQGYLMATLAPREKPAKNPYRATISVFVMMLIALGVGGVFTKMASSSITANQTPAWSVGTEVAAETEAETEEEVQEPVPAPVLSPDVVAAAR